MILERTSSQPSLGDDATKLLQLKAHAGLHLSSSWTEKDTLLSGYLDAAEQIVDRLGGCPYRSRDFKLSLPKLRKCGRFWGFELPMHPLTSEVSIAWTSDTASGVYVQGTDFDVFGELSLRPEVLFKHAFQPPCTHTLPYPYIVTFSAGPGEEGSAAWIAILELAAYYYKNPEAQSQGSVPQSTVFDANISILKGSFM